MLRVFILTFFGLLVACQTYEILPKPVVYDEVRTQLTLDFLKDHYGLVQDYPLIEPTMVVVHWTSLGDLESVYQVYKDPRKPRFRNDDAYLPDELNVSTHYLVDRDGTIYQLLPDSVMARHVIGLNYCAVGIKNIGNDQAQPLTPAQLQSNVYLVELLAKRYHIKYLIGNYESRLFVNDPLWKNFTNQPLENKQDPGVEFMRKLRFELRKSDLLGPPEN